MKTDTIIGLSCHPSILIAPSCLVFNWPSYVRFAYLNYANAIGTYFSVHVRFGHCCFIIYFLWWFLFVITPSSSLSLLRLWTALIFFLAHLFNSECTRYVLQKPRKFDTRRNNADWAGWVVIIAFFSILQFLDIQSVI